MILDTNTLSAWAEGRAALARQHGLAVLSNDDHFDIVNGVRRIAF